MRRRPARPPGLAVGACCAASLAGGEIRREGMRRASRDACKKGSRERQAEEGIASAKCSARRRRRRRSVAGSGVGRGYRVVEAALHIVGERAAVLPFTQQDLRSGVAAGTPDAAAAFDARPESAPQRRPERNAHLEPAYQTLKGTPEAGVRCPRRNPTRARRKLSGNVACRQAQKRGSGATEWQKGRISARQDERYGGSDICSSRYCMVIRHKRGDNSPPLPS